MKLIDPAIDPLLPDLSLHVPPGEEVPKLGTINLPNSLFWVDELTWSPVVTSMAYSISGSLILEQGLKQAGRPITLQPPDQEMGWVRRDLVVKLTKWAESLNRSFILQLEYPNDTRSFKVMFRHADGAVASSPVKGFPEHTPDSWHSLTLRFIEVL